MHVYSMFIHLFKGGSVLWFSQYSTYSNYRSPEYNFLRKIPFNKPGTNRKSNAANVVERAKTLCQHVFTCYLFCLLNLCNTPAGKEFSFQVTSLKQFLEPVLIHFRMPSKHANKKAVTRYYEKL